MMQVFLVGGAVRDELLGFPVQERDWVVVGQTPEEMLQKGYKSVGREFPVYLHPETHEEYALARTERKTGPGYRGFSVNAAPDVTLNEDLFRRDLTINAMARDAEGNLVDPYNGRRDLDARVLRHVSSAFCEDPVRILRVARFAARYSHIGFRVADDTHRLMKSMVEGGEVNALVPERVWAEVRRALSERTPAVFFHTLRECGAAALLFPEIDCLFGVPQPPNVHPEIDAGIHTLLVLEQAARLSDSSEVRFAALTHDLGKGLTPKVQWPHHCGHEERGGPALDQLCNRLRVPTGYRKLAVKVMRFHEQCHRVFELSPTAVVDLLLSLDVFRQSDSLERFLFGCEADARGRKGFEEKTYPQADFLRVCREAALSVDVQSAMKNGLKGAAVGKELYRLRVDAVRKCRKR